MGALTLRQPTLPYILLLLALACAMMWHCSGAVLVLNVGALVTIPEEERQLNPTYDGTFEEESQATIRSYRLWQEIVNSQGGILIGNATWQINLTLINIGSTAEEAGVRALEACTGAHQQPPLRFFLGPYSSSLTAAVASSIDQCDAVLISSGASSRDLFVCSDSTDCATPVGSRRFRNLWGVLNIADRYYSDAISMYRLANAKSLAIFYDDSFPWSLNVARGVRSAARSNGFFIAYDQVFPKNSSNALMASFVEDIARTNPDVVVAVFYSSRARSFLRSLRSSRFLPQGLIVRLAADDENALSDLDVRFITDINYFNRDLTGDDYTDTQYFLPSSNLTSAAVFSRAFSDRFQVAPGGNIEAVALVAGQVLHRALTLSGQAEPAAVMTAMSTIRFNSIIGKVQFSPFGYNEGLQSITVQRDQNNLLRIVAPLSTANSDLIYPLPSWEERTENLTRFSSPMEHGILVATALLIAVSLGCVVFTAMYRRRTVVHQATPSMLVIFLAGSILLYVGVIFWGLNPTDGDCNATVFFVGTGFVCMFASLFSRTYRIFAISNNTGYRNSRKDVTDTRLLVIVCVLVVVEWVPTILWMIMAPNRAVLVVPDPVRPSLNYRFCRPQEPVGIIFLAVYLIYKLLLLVAGLILSARVWNVHRYSVETKQIAFAMYNLLISLALCGCSFLIFTNQREMGFMLRSVSVILGVAVTVATVFIPKISVVCSRKKPRSERSRYRADAGSSAPADQDARVRFSGADTNSPSAGSRTGTRTGTREGLMDSYLGGTGAAPVASPAAVPSPEFSQAPTELNQLQLEVIYLRGIVNDLNGRLAAYEPSDSADSSSRASVLQQPSVAASVYSASGPAQSERGSALRKDMFFESVAASQDSAES